MLFSRRDVARLAAAVVPVAWARTGHARGDERTRREGLWAQGRARAVAGRFGGVEVGLIAPDLLDAAAQRPEPMLALALRLGLASIELRGEPIEAKLGAPQRPAPGTTPAPAAAAPPTPPTGAATTPPTPAAAAPPQAAGTPGTSPKPLTPAQIAAQVRAALRTWRLAATAETFAPLKAQFAKAGVAINVLRMPLGDGMSDEELDYSFNAARWLGARAVTCDAPVSHARRLGLFADKHRMRVGFSGQSDVTTVDAFGRPGAWEQAFFYSPLNGACLDVGHYTAGNGTTALDFLRRYHGRITNLHLSDRRTGQGPSVPWGEGNTPLREILQLVQRERYALPVTIALSYPIPPSSSVEAELARCVAFCEAALAGPVR